MDIDIPIPYGVPYLGGSPKFWTTTATSLPSFDTRIDDPRWTGSYAFGWGSGAGSLVLLRIGWFHESGQDYLYLSFHCRVDALSDKEDQLWIGLDTAHGELFIKIEWDSKGTVTSSPQTDAGGETVWIATVHERMSASSNRVNPGTVAGATPQWIYDNTRAWRAEVGVAPHINYPWAIHMRIPIKPTATSKLDPEGVSIDKSDFRMWVYGEQWYNEDSGTGLPLDSTPFQWPPEYYGDGTPKAPYDDDSNFSPPAMSAWNKLKCVSTATGAGGIAIWEGSFGTRNPGSTNQYEFIRNFNNTFFAKPVNNDPAAAVPAGSIGATFRMANWGSTIGEGGDWEALSVTYVDAVRKDTNRGDLPAGGAAPSNTADIEVQWDSSAWEGDIALGIKTDHQCMAVDLDVRAGSYSLSKASAVQNMNFVTNSVQVREAEINLKGAGALVDFAYLFLEMVGMTEGAYNWEAAAENALAQNPKDKELIAVVDRLRPIFAEASQGQNIEDQVAAALADVDMDIIQRLIPFAKVHVYYPTGQKIRRHGRQCAVTTPATSYGLFGLAQHTEGWRAAFDGAVRINENLYQIPVPKTLRKVRVSTKLQGLHKNEKPLRIQPVVKLGGPSLGEGILSGLLDRLDLLQRLQRRISDRIWVLEEITRRAANIGERITGAAWAGEARKVLGEVKEHGITARETASSLSRHQQSAAGLEQKLTVMDSFLDALSLHDESTITAVVKKAFGTTKGVFPQILAVAQSAYMSAWKLSPIVETGTENMRAAETLVLQADDAAGLLRRIERDFDRRSPFDIDLDIPPITREPDLLAPLPKKALPGGAETLRRAMPRLNALSRTLKDMRKRFDAVDTTHRGLSEIVKDLGQFDEALVRKLTIRLQRAGG